MDKLRLQCSLALTHQITHNNMFYKTKLLVRLQMINVQPNCNYNSHVSVSRIYNIIVSQSLLIKNHEVIQVSVGLIQYSNLISGALMNTTIDFFYVYRALDNLQSDSWQSSFNTYFQSIYRLWMVWIILLFGKSKHAKWNTRIILILYGPKLLSINKTPLFNHHIDYSLLIV